MRAYARLEVEHRLLELFVVLLESGDGDARLAGDVLEAAEVLLELAYLAALRHDQRVHGAVLALERLHVALELADPLLFGLQLRLVLKQLIECVCVCIHCKTNDITFCVSIIRICTSLDAASYLDMAVASSRLVISMDDRSTLYITSNFIYFFVQINS